MAVFPDIAVGRIAAVVAPFGGAAGFGPGEGRAERPRDRDTPRIGVSHIRTSLFKQPRPKRALQSRHCERSEAIHSSSCCTMDCFAALAMTPRYRFAISPRVSREFCS